MDFFASSIHSAAFSIYMWQVLFIDSISKVVSQVKVQFVNIKWRNIFELLRNVFVMCVFASSEWCQTISLGRRAGVDQTVTDMF